MHRAMIITLTYVIYRQGKEQRTQDSPWVIISPADHSEWATPIVVVPKYGIPLVPGSRGGWWKSHH